MKILHLTTHLNQGGITRYIYTLSQEFKNRGHIISVASSGGETLEQFSKGGIKHIHIPIKTKKEISLSVLFSYFILKKYLSKNPVDIIHAHTRVTQVLGTYLSKRFKVPLVTTCHGFFKPRWHRRMFPCWGDKVIAISSQVQKHLISDFKINPKNICLIHHGLDLKKFKEKSIDEINILKRELGVQQNHFVVGSAGRFSQVKGLEYFVRAAPNVLKEVNNVVFLFIGYGEEEEKLRQTAKDLKIENNVIFFNPKKESFEYLCALDIFVMPSIQEGLGLSLLEANAQKIPVIASNVGGIPDIIQQDLTGILVQPQNSQAISGAVLKLINDPNLRLKIADNAYKRIAQEFSLERMIDRTEEVYEEIMY